MDNVTHTLVGAVTAQAFFKRKIGPEAVPVLCWSSNLPDIDALALLWRNPAAVTMRRTFGHSALLLPFWCAGLALIFRRLYPKQPYWALLGLCLLGAGVHVFFDLVNSFGVVALWPVSSYRPELAIVYIIDLLLTGLLAAPFLVTRLAPWRGRLRQACRISVAFVCAYILFCAGARLQAEVLLQRQTAGLQPEFTYVFPEPLGPHRWRGVVRFGGEYRIYLINALTGRIGLAALTRTQQETPAVAAVRRASPLARRLEAFFKAPVWTATPHPEGGTAVTVHDLRFSSLVLDRGRPFQYAFRVLPDGRVEERNLTKGSTPVVK